MTLEKKDHVFDNSWLPDILPVSTREIRVSIDMDLNTAKGEFSFETSDFDDFVPRLLAKNSKTFEYSEDEHTWVFQMQR